MPEKLWSKGYKLDALAEQFTVGEDYLLDRDLVDADALGSIAHARMLMSIGILTESEFHELQSALADVIACAANGRFEICLSDEDVHTAVENYLVEKLGALGKKVHTGRSRNDQVILDTRLFTRERLLHLERRVSATARKLLEFAEEHKEVPMVGRTHTQRAMPSSVGLWASAFAESLADDLEVTRTAYILADQCPLGSAASYGVALPLDREMVAELLGFERVQTNVLYVNNSRGKMASIALGACTEIMLDLAKLSADLIWFSTPEFDYFTLPDKYCPGSSIMPQKKNPGPLELIRGKSAEVQGAMFTVQNIIRALPSGYNRDLQLTKGPLMRGLAATANSADMMLRIFSDLRVNQDKMIAAFSPEVFAADRAIELASQGIPFRDAYRQVADELDELAECDPRENIKSKTHTGAPGNLRLDLIQAKLDDTSAFFEARGKTWDKAREKLLGF